MTAFVVLRFFGRFVVIVVPFVLGWSLSLLALGERKRAAPPRRFLSGATRSSAHNVRERKRRFQRERNTHCALCATLVHSLQQASRTGRAPSARVQATSLLPCWFVRVRRAQGDRRPASKHGALVCKSERRRGRASAFRGYVCAEIPLHRKEHSRKLNCSPLGTAGTVSSARKLQACERRAPPGTMRARRAFAIAPPPQRKPPEKQQHTTCLSSTLTD